MDDLKKKGAADRNKINLHEPWEVDHWTWLLGVSKDARSKKLATPLRPSARNWAASQMAHGQHDRKADIRTSRVAALMFTLGTQFGLAHYALGIG